MARTNPATPATPAALSAQRRTGHRAARPGRAGSIGRGAAVTALLVLAAALLAGRAQVRGFEAWLASHVIGLGTAAVTGTEPGRPTFWFMVPPGRIFALEITPEGTVAILVVPFLVATAVLVGMRRPMAGPLAALSVALVLLVVVSQLRILTTAWFVQDMGPGGAFSWGHTLVTALIMVFGVSVTLAAYALIAVRQGTAARS